LSGCEEAAQPFLEAIVYKEHLGQQRRTTVDHGIGVKRLHVPAKVRLEGDKGVQQSVEVRGVQVAFPGPLPIRTQLALDPVSDSGCEEMGPPVYQVFVDGALLHSGSRGRCRNDFLKGHVYGRQLQALEKGRGHDDSSQVERSEVWGV
jgi:hypothetical protein